MVKVWETLLNFTIQMKQWLQRRIGSKMEIREIKENFAPLYDKLIVDEQELEVLMTAYAKGEDVKMADIDAAFKGMKESLREIRKLALEYKETKREQTEEDH